MSIRRALVALVAALLVTGPFVALSPGPATSAQPKTVYFDLFYQPHVTPKRIFVTASSGPWMKNLHWEGWGTRKAVAHGAWISDCASCPGPDRRKVKLTFTKPVYCQAQGVRTYRKARGVVSVPDEGSTDTHFSIGMGCPPPD